MPRCSVWLMPRSGDKDLLRDRITELSGLLKAPEFPPHVTLLGNLDLSADQARALLHDVRLPAEGITLDTMGLGAEDDRFKSLFIGFKDSQALTSLRDRFKAALGDRGAQATTDSPHLSLAYPTVPPGSRTMLGYRSKVPLERSYTFDKLAIWGPAEEANGSWENVTGWRQLAASGGPASAHLQWQSRMVIIFPFGGFTSWNEERAEYFRHLIEHATRWDCKETPLVVLNADTENRGQAEAFLKSDIYRKVDVVRCWSVDTCQMWLAGWGAVLAEESTQDDRVVLLPGDLDNVTKDFWDKLRNFATAGNADIVLGDYQSSPDSSKALIDTYGTYSLLVNWFPEHWKELRGLHLNKARTEFLNVRLGVLRLFLNERKFAYEQTLNMLVRNWRIDRQSRQLRKRFTVARYDLGMLRDQDSFRSPMGSVDQIERTERMLKFLWREMSPLESQSLVDEYVRRDETSTAIARSAILMLGAMLESEGSPPSAR